jgi:CRP/FNR family transcriptional regulator, cyclic AMP receptor protein
LPQVPFSLTIPAPGTSVGGICVRKAATTYRVRVSQERLGMMLSLSRQTVNELLRQMEQESMIQCERGGVRILDPGRLREGARGSA